MITLIRAVLVGVGRVMSNKLETLNIRTCQQLQSLSLPLLQKHFGQKTGQMLFRCARGEDDRMLKTAIERKSVSAEINYGIRFTMVSWRWWSYGAKLQNSSRIINVLKEKKHAFKFYNSLLIFFFKILFHNWCNLVVKNLPISLAFFSYSVCYSICPES